MKRYKKAAGILAVLLAAVLCGGCMSTTMQKTGEQSTEVESENSGVEKEEKPEINEIHLRDKDTLYENDDDTSVVTMYLTVSRGNSSENTDHSWSEINSYSVSDYEEMGVERYQVAGLLQVGDENGPEAGEVGYGEKVPNATVQIRGQTSSRYAQKNYKIELKKNKGTWRGQRTINLNKHMGEGMRFRNKLAYDLLKGIPELLSLRTQFVHLYVKDETEGENGGFSDYGLYTQVEQLNKTGMKAHGLDFNGQLYKVNSFEFYRYEDVIKKEDEAGYDQRAFEERLEIKGSSDHRKLIRMLEAVNDYSKPVSTVLEQYFDKENLTYWMAFQILTGNVDTQNRNTYLYSPLNSDTWYFICWDNDGAFMRSEYVKRQFSDQGSWESGVSNYWGNILFQRCLQSETFREELDEAILDLKTYLSEDRLRTMIGRYQAVVKPYAYSMPDQMNEPLTEDAYDEIASEIPGEVENNYQLYLESLKKPMPFYIGKPVITGQKLKVNWDISYDFDAEDITYTVEVARDYLFRDVIYRSERQLLPEAELDLPEAGQYFVRVQAENSSGYTQDAFDYYVTDSGKNYGMRCFYITQDGRVEEDLYGE
ncbi:spore coat protein CotH [Blautia sp. OF03-15BH]|uniref:CotH kinase family protein n=1 Tax=Blautia sp. OF03-15BH TaxID=2292287 RepID=UPI000E51A4E4|nr:CotH kinase family protein [Blautia sp. OF03-15BH]RGY03193.1 spore coat protein CotH [Blautia sp. OF03-15BH]